MVLRIDVKMSKMALNLIALIDKNYKRVRFTILVKLKYKAKSKANFYYNSF